MTVNRQRVEQVSDRQERIDGFDQAIFRKSSITLAGAGGIGSEIGEGLVRKGIGTLQIFDFDQVEVSNLNRQHFGKRDVGTNKAFALGRNLSRTGCLGTKIVAHPMSFEDGVDRGIDLLGDIVVAGVDSDTARLAISKYCLEHNKAMISAATDRQAQYGAVFVQEVGGQCYQCLFPNAGQLQPSGRQACEPAAAVKDTLKLVASLALYAIDSTLMYRPRNWNFRQISLASDVFDKAGQILVRSSCPLCSSFRDADHE